MSKSIKILGIIILIILSPIILIFSIGILRMSYFLVMRYPFDMTGGELAVKITNKGWDPAICHQLRQTLPDLGPTISEQRATCIYDVAAMRKDPYVCELMMPSSYGWSCVGAAQKKESPCVFGSYAKPQVRGNGIEATLQECINGPSNTRSNACCLMAKLKYTDEIQDCSIFGDAKEMNDQCHHETAFKTKDQSDCALIQDNNTRAVCEVQVRALNNE